MKHKIFLSLAVIAATFSTACGFEHSSNVLIPSNIPSAAMAPAAAAPAALSYLRAWTSQSIVPPSPNSCSNFQWRITSQTPTSVAGDLSATCSGIIVAASATGQLNGTSVPLTVNGTATVSGLPACSFSLAGTGTIEGDTLRIPYSGTTCLGPVQGTEVLRRPASPPAPAPAPPTGHSHHVGPGPLSAIRARQVVFATADEFPILTA